MYQLEATMRFTRKHPVASIELYGFTFVAITGRARKAIKIVEEDYVAIICLLTGRQSGWQTLLRQGSAALNQFWRRPIAYAVAVFMMTAIALSNLVFVRNVFAANFPIVSMAESGEAIRLKTIVITDDAPDIQEQRGFFSPTGMFGLRICQFVEIVNVERLLSSPSGFATRNDDDLAFGHFEREMRVIQHIAGVGFQINEKCDFCCRKVSSISYFNMPQNSFSLYAQMNSRRIDRDIGTLENSSISFLRDEGACCNFRAAIISYPEQYGGTKKEAVKQDKKPIGELIFRVVGSYFTAAGLGIGLGILIGWWVSR